MALAAPTTLPRGRPWGGCLAALAPCPETGGDYGYYTITDCGSSAIRQLGPDSWECDRCCCGTYGFIHDFVGNGSAWGDGYSMVSEAAARADAEANLAATRSYYGGPDWVCICSSTQYAVNRGVPDAFTWSGNVQTSCMNWGDAENPFYYCSSTEAYTMTCNTLQPGCCMNNTDSIPGGTVSLSPALPNVLGDACNCTAASGWHGNLALCAEYFKTGHQLLDDHCSAVCQTNGYYGGKYSYSVDTVYDHLPDCSGEGYNRRCWAPVYCCCDK